MQGTARFGIIFSVLSARTSEPSDGDGCQSCPGPCRLHQNTRPIIAAGALCSARVGVQARFSHTEFHRANARTRDARKEIEFCQRRLVRPALPILPAIDPFNLAFIKRPPAVLFAPSWIRPRGDSPFSCLWGPPARHGQSFPAEPLDPTKCGPPPSPGPRPAPFFWPAVVSSMELPVPFDQNPRLPPAVPVPPSRRCCCPDCDSFCWRSFD